MKPVKSVRCHITLLVIAYFTFSGSVLVVSQTVQGTLCPEGWTLFKDYNNGGLCILPVQEARVWEKAARFCKEKYAHLINLDIINQYSYPFPREERNVGLGEHLFEAGLQDFWSGMHVSKGRLLWSAYGPEYVKRRSYESFPWKWGEGQPSTEIGNCGRVNLGSRVEQRMNYTNKDEGFPYNITVFDNEYTIALDTCDEERQFVCQTPAIPDIVENITHCEAGWVGNAFLPFCYRKFDGQDELSSYEAADKRCRSLGGQLAPVTTNLDNRMAAGTNDFFYKEVLEAEGVWVYNRLQDKVEGQCQALSSQFSDGVVSEPIQLLCNTALPFICRKLATFEEPKRLKMITRYTSQKGLLEYIPFFGLPVSCVMSRPPTESEILFIETPAGIINSTNNWNNARVELGFDVTMSDATDRPYFFNVTIPRIEIPQRKRRELSDQRDHVNFAINIHEGRDIPREKRQSLIDEIPRLNIQPSEAELVKTIGYYTCGIKSRFIPQFLSTEPVLVRYSELDLYIYILEVSAKDEFISPDGYTTLQDLISFNLMQDMSYVNMIQEFIGTVMEYPDEQSAWANNIQSYKAVLEQIRLNSGITLQFRVIVGIDGSRLFPREFEQTVMYGVEAYWKQRIDQVDMFENVKIKSTVACPLKEYNNRELGRKATFPVTRIGKTAYSWERCYTEKGALAVAECQGDFDTGARWVNVQFRDVCKTSPDISESESTSDLRNLSMTTLTKDNILQIINYTVYLTSPKINLSEADIIYTADILYNFQLFEFVNEEIVNKVFGVVNNVLETTRGVIYGAQKLDNSANRIIQALDELTYNIRLIKKQSPSFIRDYVVAQVWQQTRRDNLTIGISLKNDSSDKINRGSISSVKDSGEVEVGRTDVAIYLPADVVKGKQSRLTFHIYGKPDLFTPVGGRYKTNSKVVAARLNKDGEDITDLGNDTVTSVFLPFEREGNLTCGFWDYNAQEDGGGWNTEGCSVSFDNDRVICKCNHLTNFAVLIDLEAHKISETHKQILSIITTVGLIVSIVGLGLTILGFLIFKHLRNGRGQQVLVNLSLAMLCSAIIFLVGMDKTSDKIGCIVVAALLHYFILVSFMWMLVEGVLQYLRFVKVLGTYIPNFLIKSAIPAWGLPLIPVIVVLALDYNLYYGGKGYCWLSFEPMLYAFIIPVGAIILANIIVFTMVLCNLFRRRTKGMQVNQSERKMAFLHFKAALSIFVVLGLTWVFGFLAIEDARIVFHYIFAILNAFQGFFIFLLFTVREKLVRQAWMKFCCGRKYREKQSSAQSGTDSRTGRKTSQDTSALTVSSGSKFDNLSDDRRNYLNGNKNHSNNF